MKIKKYIKAITGSACALAALFVGRVSAYGANGISMSNGIDRITSDLQRAASDPQSFNWLLILSIVFAVAAAVALTVLIITSVTSIFTSRK